MSFKSESTAAIAQSMKDLNKAGLPVIDLKHFAVAGSGLARIVANVVHTDASRQNPELVTQAIAKKFENQLQAVAGSIHVVDSGPLTDTITGVLGVQRETIAVNGSDNLKGFKAVASNMYLDDEDRMWTLNTTAAGNLLVRANGVEDDAALLNMLSAVASAAQTSTESVNLRAVASSVRQSLAAGQYVSYVNVNNVLAHGYIVAMAGDETALVLAPGQEEAETINVNAVVASHEISDEVLLDLDEDEKTQIAIASARGAVPIEAMVDYYRRVFIRSPEYFQQFEQRLRGHAFC